MRGLIFFFNFGLVLGIISSNIFFYFFFSLLSFGSFAMYVVRALNGVPHFSEVLLISTVKSTVEPFW